MDNAVTNSAQNPVDGTSTDLTTDESVDNLDQNVHPVVAGFNKLSIVLIIFSPTLLETSIVTELDPLTLAYDCLSSNVLFTFRKRN